MWASAVATDGNVALFGCDLVNVEKIPSLISSMSSLVVGANVRRVSAATLLQHFDA